MSILLQHISSQFRRATYSRRGTAAALTPPHTFSRFYSTNNRALGPQREETSMKFWGKFVLLNGLAISFMYGTYYWVDYGGYRKAEVEKQLEDALRFGHPCSVTYRHFSGKINVVCNSGEKAKDNGR